jgi:endonuclease/exonuclease/phosphatase family metal-dependent hydrolase
MVNHFKSKGYGSQIESNGRREAQADRVREIYEELRARGVRHIAIIGDLNDTPDSAPLAPLIGGTDLKDISTHDHFDSGGFPGTFGSSTASNKIDYLLLSPDLMAKVRAGGIFRKGMWPGVRPKKWEAYEEITASVHAASDHGAIWAEIDV